MPPARTGARLTADLAAVADQLRRWATWLPGQPLEAGTVLPGWTLGELAAHLEIAARGLVERLGRPSSQAPLAPLDYLTGDAPAADEIGQAARDRAEVLGEGVAAALAEAAELVAGADPSRAPAVLEGPRGPLRREHWIATRVVDVAVHGDDLVRSLPSAPPTTRRVEASAVRHLLGWLAEVHPGQTVEVRVPPHGAVQCGVEGTALAHTRGTPPNVVEMSPAVFLRLAAGRLGWAEARGSGQVSASGHRADLSDWLPLL